MYYEASLRGGLVTLGEMNRKGRLLIDGGFLRSVSRAAHQNVTPAFQYNPAFIERFALSCKEPDEEFLRILYYDCAPFSGTALRPISGTVETFTGSSVWLHEVAELDLFAVRLGVLKFRGYERKSAQQTGPLTDGDFKARFEQKGVDMRIGLDIAAYSSGKLADRVILITNDTDCVPAMKYARKAGLQTVLIQVPNCKPASELLEHTDLKRARLWP
jgi:uncharacterized LabA/DUF88 family protein